MLHKQVEALARPTTEHGTLTALASVFGNVDRTGDRVMPGAFSATIRAWRESGKSLPTHWNHETTPEDIIGTVDPNAMEEVGEGLLVEVKLDLEDSERAREAWRLVKQNSVGLSFGFKTDEERIGSDGINELHRIDLFEISLTPSPANPEARILKWKNNDTRERDMLEWAAREAGYIIGADAAAPRPAKKSTAPVRVATFEC